MKKIFLISIILFAFACSTAQKATDVQSIRIPIAPYLKMDCQELATEQNALLKEASSARSAVDSAYQSDKNTELVTWILFAPAAFWLDGNQEETQKLAAIKGQLDAVQEAQKINKCTTR